MKGREQLIEDILCLQEKLNSLILANKVDNWIRLDLTIDQLKSLIIIEREGKISFNELARALGITRSNITGIADRLVRSGLVTRNPNLTGDRRLQFLALTNKGKSILSNIRQVIISEWTRILESLNNEDLAALKRGLSAVVDSAEEHVLLLQREQKKGAAEVTSS